MSDEYTLVTADCHFVAKVEPLLPLGPSGDWGDDEVVFWGYRVFVKREGRIYREVRPLVVKTCEP